VNWIMLYIAIAFEVAGTTALKLSEGLENLLFFTGALIFYGISFFFLSLALKAISISVAYAIWSGLGTVLVTVIGFMIFKDPVSVPRLAFIALIIAGCMGLNLLGD
jgi:small multidrug resistance pump